MLREALKLAQTMVRRGERRTQVLRHAMQRLIHRTPEGRIDYVGLAHAENVGTAASRLARRNGCVTGGVFRPDAPDR